MATYCSTALPAYTEDICANLEGRIISVAYIRSDSNLDSTNYTDVDTWNTEITAGRVVVIKNVKGSKPKSTANEIEGFGRESSRTVGREFTANYMHPDVEGNEDFYNVLNYDSAHRFAYWVGGKRLFVVEEEYASIDADHVTEEANDSIAFWDRDWETYEQNHN